MKPYIIFDFYGVLYDYNGFNHYLLEIINILKENKYKVYLLSNIEEKIFLRIFEKLDFRDYFDEVFLSSKIGYEKPDPRAFTYLLSKIKKEPEECIFIDDNSNNVDQAINLGFERIEFRSNEEIFNLFRSKSFLEWYF